MIRISRHIAIDEREIEESFIRASGPGGQNVNKLATAVQLRFDVRRSPALPDAVRLRLEKGELKLSASSTETGESEDSMEADYNGETLTIGFNAQYLVDFLKAAGTSEVRLELKDSQSAGQLRPAEGDDYKYRYIVMPMRI